MADKKGDPKVQTCPCGCNRTDQDPKIHGMNLDGEWWCPRGFVHQARNLHPGRFQSSRVKASKCGSCGCEVIDLGMGRCTACNDRLTLALPPVQPEDAVKKAVEASGGPPS